MPQIKGWIGDAADEIVKRQENKIVGDLGSSQANLPLGVDVVQSIIQKHYTLKLARGPLGTGEGATMPIPRCDSCQLWRVALSTATVQSIGKCAALLMMTDQDFGCVKFTGV